ncbi:MAG: type I 3-dehydroquinate dehydratase [Bacteroidales bacterium]|nr:type I 3-dehydroquinate dehydratase [Bacteroidales bacterium]
MEDLSLRICRSVHFNSLESANEIFSTPKLFAELRFDLSSISLESISKLILPEKLIFTCRPNSWSYNKRLKAYSLALESEVDYIDLDFETDFDLIRDLKSEMSLSNTQLILSQHNYALTPNYMQLQESVYKAFDLGADIAKIITTASVTSDVDRVYSLYQRFDDIVAFAMGEKGRESRAKILTLGAPFTYAAFSEQEKTAPGQMDFQQTVDLYHRIKTGRI